MLRRSSLIHIDALGAGFCLLASLLCYVAVVGPSLQRIAAAANLRNELEEQQLEARQRQAEIASTRERLTAAQQELAAAAIRLDPATQVNSRIARLTAFFSRCELQVDDVQVGGHRGGAHYDLVPMAFVGRGGYARCIEFIQGLRAEFPDMGVIRVELSGHPAQATEPQRFQLEMFWYTAPNGPVAGDEASGLDGRAG